MHAGEVDCSREATKRKWTMEPVPRTTQGSLGVQTLQTPDVKQGVRLSVPVAATRALSRTGKQTNKEGEREREREIDRKACTLLPEQPKSKARLAL